MTPPNKIIAPDHPAKDVAVVVPVHNEADNISSLISEIEQALNGNYDFEIIYVDDASTDETADKLIEIAATSPRLRIIHHSKCCGQSAAISTGIRAAVAPVIATLDGDGQNDPANIPTLMNVLADTDEPDRLLVAGLRAKRKDTWVKRMSSRIANRVRARLLKDDTADTGCGLKVFTRKAFLDMPRFDHMHRFLPALMIRLGGRVLSVPVNHRPRERGTSKYGTFDRLRVGIVDLFGVMWLQRRASLPEAREIAADGTGEEDA